MGRIDLYRCQQFLRDQFIMHEEAGKREAIIPVRQFSILWMCIEGETFHAFQPERWTLPDIALWSQATCGDHATLSCAVKPAPGYRKYSWGRKPTWAFHGIDVANINTMEMNLRTHTHTHDVQQADETNNNTTVSVDSEQLSVLTAKYFSKYKEDLERN